MILPRSQRHLLVRGGTVVTMDPERRVFEGDVLVTEGRIAAVGSRLETPPATRLLDAGGLFVIPGLVQAHVHLGHRLFRGLPVPGRADWKSPSLALLESSLGEDEVVAAARLAAAECLLAGATQVAEFGVPGHARGLARAVEETGIRAGIGILLRDRVPGKGEPGPDRTDRVLREATELASALDGTARNRIRANLSPDSVETVSRSLWSGAVGAAGPGGLLHTHIEGGGASPRELERLQEAEECGVRLLAAHGVHLEPRIPPGTADSAPGLVYCPLSELHLGLGTVDLSRWKGVAAQGLALGSDGIGGLLGFDPWEAMRAALALQSAGGGADAWSARDVFESATLGGARVLGYGQESGSLEAGKWGDLVVLDLEKPGTVADPAASVYDRLVLGAGPRAVRWVVVDGEVVVEQGLLPHLDSEGLVHDAARAAIRIRSAVEALA